LRVNIAPVTAPYALFVTTVLIAIGAGTEPLVAVANAASVRCGMVVDDRATLDRDLRCDGPAFILRNPRTVLQLNGHSVESRRSCAEGAAPAGIVVESTADGAQILGPGVVRGFVTGIRVTGTARTQVRDVRVSDCCTNGLLVDGATGFRVHGSTFHRNGTVGEDGTAVRVEQARRFALEASEIFLNGANAHGAAVDLHACEQCRIAENRIIGNRGAGIRLDLESHAGTIERNVALDQRASDIIDEGSDNTFALNVFERGDGVAPPSLWPLTGRPDHGAPGVAGCGTMIDFIKPRQTVTVTCPQDPGLRALRNSVVGYRLLLGGDKPSGATCNPAALRPAHSGGGGSITCTNPDSIWGLVFEVTCCLN